MLKKFDTTTYTVINDDLIRKCIVLRKDKDDDDKKISSLEIKAEQVEFYEVEQLVFSFQNINRISSLEGFDNLVKLQLDNNHIKKIENLSQLRNLEELDLSFNEITKIEGLDNLVKLQVLSLYSNKIKVIENLDNLTNLQCLSIARNVIEDKENIVYLRRFKKLSMIVIEDNPVCNDKGFKYMVLAYLKHLKFLDYRRVSEEDVQIAKERFHEIVLQLDDQELQEEKDREIARQKAIEDEKMREANLAGIPELFDRMIKEDPEEKNIQPWFSYIEDLFEKYSKRFEDEVNAFKETMQKNLQKKKDEIEDFEKVIQMASKEAETTSRKLIRDFEKKKKRALNHMKLEILDYEEAFKVIEELKSDLAALKEKLLEIEVNLSEQFAEIISEFEQNYKELDSSEDIQTFFKNLKKEETKYSNSLMRRFQKIMTSKEAMEGDMSMIISLDDKDHIEGTLRRSTESHQDTLAHKEEELLKIEKQRIAEQIKKIKEREHFRNRSRIAEIWTFCDRIKEELNEEEQEYEQNYDN